MRLHRITDALLLLTLFADARSSLSQAVDSQPVAAQTSAPYRLSVSVDEVILTFHAADAHGLPVNDLKLEELRLLDNGKPPAKVFAFQLLHDAPIRAGILIDTSESIQNYIGHNRAIAAEYAQQIVRQRTDQAFVADFVRRARILQPWSSNPAALTAAIGKISAGAGSLSHGTAIFDTLYHACEFQFGAIDHAASGNFILLFSDGEDNASEMHLQDAVDACQSANTAIYAFRAEAEPGFSSPGPAILTQLAAQTGGRVFRENASHDAIGEDLRLIEADLRNQYRLVYKPATLKHDGAFHQIALLPPQRVDQITIRSGYYAPAP